MFELRKIKFKGIQMLQKTCLKQEQTEKRNFCEKIHMVVMWFSFLNQRKQDHFPRTDFNETSLSQTYGYCWVPFNSAKNWQNGAVTRT